MVMNYSTSLPCGLLTQINMYVNVSLILNNLLTYVNNLDDKV